MADFFDVNAAGSDSHLQFTNWTVDNNGAYDYAADTRGYTYAAIVEYDTPTWALRFGEALMPTVANGIDMDWHIAQARAENLEFELRPAAGLAVRLLGYANHANMGSYDEAIAGFLAGRDPKPDVIAYRQPGRVKTGFGVNTEYTFPRLVRVFARAGWNEGHNESFAYTEVNDSVQAGGDLSGALVESIAGSGRSCRSLKRSVGAAPRLSRPGRSGIPPRRRHTALWARGYRRDVLHRASLARGVRVWWSAVHRPSRLQPGPGAGPRGDDPTARGLLTTHKGLLPRP